MEAPLLLAWFRVSRKVQRLVFRVFSAASRVPNGAEATPFFAAVKPGVRGIRNGASKDVINRFTSPTTRLISPESVGVAALAFISVDSIARVAPRLVF